VEVQKKSKDFRENNSVEKNRFEAKMMGLLNIMEG
jgi:hypothetical protein